MRHIDLKWRHCPNCGTKLTIKKQIYFCDNCAYGYSVIEEIKKLRNQKLKRILGC